MMAGTRNAAEMIDDDFMAMSTGNNGHLKIAWACMP